MSDTGFVKYQTFIDGHRDANPQMKKSEQLLKAQDLWKTVKKDPEKMRQMMIQFKEKAAKRDQKLKSYWSKFPAASTAKPAKSVEVQSPPVIVEQLIEAQPKTSSLGK